MPSSTIYTDQELFLMISNGDEQAFTILFHKYRSIIFDYGMKITKSVSASEEMVQDLFLKLWTNRETLTEVENPGGYIHRMARNAGINYLRQISTSKKHYDRLESRSSSDDYSTEESVNLGETRRILNEATAHLTPAQKEVFILSRYEGLSYEEIAEKLGISKNTVRNHLTASLKHLRDYLGKHYEPVIVYILSYFLR